MALSLSLSLSLSGIHFSFVQHKGRRDPTSTGTLFTCPIERTKLGIAFWASDLALQLIQSLNPFDGFDKEGLTGIRRVRLNGRTVRLDRLFCARDHKKNEV